MAMNSHSLTCMALACFFAARVTSVCHEVDEQAVAAPNVDVVSEWRTFTMQDGLPDDGIRALHVAADRLWVGTDRGLAAYDGSAWTTWTTVGAQPLPAVSAIDVDEALAEVWIGTWGGGLYRLSGGRLDAFTQYDSGLAGDLLFSVVIDGRDVWAATNGGVSRFDRTDGSWNLYFARRADAPVPAITKLVRAGDRLYACAWREGVYQFDAEANAWSRVDLTVSASGDAERPPASDALSTATLALSGSTLWWVTQDAASISMDERRKVFSRPPRFDQQSPRAAGFSLRERGESAAPRHETKPQNRGYVVDAAVRDSSTVWLATHRGLEVLVDPKHETWLRYGRSDLGKSGVVSMIRPGAEEELRRVESALPDDDIRCIEFSGDCVWVGTARGLACSVDHKKWQDLPDGCSGDDSDSGVINDPAQYRETLDSESSRRLKPAARQRRGIADGPLNGEKATPEGGAADDADAPKPVAVAVLGPRNPTIALPGQEPRREPGRGSPDLLALQLAVNAGGGYGGRISFDLVVSPPGYGRYGWGLPEDDFASFAAQDNVVGLVGRLHPDDRMTDAVTLWTGLPLVNVEDRPGADLPSENPWVFPCHGDAPRRHHVLLDYVFDKLGHERVAALRTPGSSAALHLDWWASHAADRGRPLVVQLDYDPFTDDLATVLDTVCAAEADVVLTWCDAALSAKIVRRMRATGMGQVFVGGPQIVEDGFARLVDPAGGSVLALPGDASGGDSFDPDFAKAYAERHLVGGQPTPPTVEGYQSFEAADHLLAAIAHAGPNRDAVRRALLDMARSVTGEAHFEERHKHGTVEVARLTENGWTVQTID